MFAPVLIQFILNIFDVLPDTVVSVVRSFLEMCQLLLQTLMDLKEINPWGKTFERLIVNYLFIVALLLLHLLELRLNVLGQIVNGDSVLLYGVIFLLVPCLVVVQLLIYLVDLLAGLVVSLQSFVLLGLDEIMYGGARLADVVHDVVGGVLDTGLGLFEIFDLFLQVLSLSILHFLYFIVMFLEQSLVRLHHVLVVRFQKLKTF